MSNMRIIEIPASLRENAGRKNTVRKLRVAAYCRVSTEEEEQQGSFEIQKLRCNLMHSICTDQNKIRTGSF